MEIEREIVFPEPPAEVWEALTEPGAARGVVRDRGRARRAARRRRRLPLGRRRGAAAVVREAEPEERLVLDWDDGGEVVLELEEVEGGTRVRVIETSPDFATALELRALACVPVT